MDKTQPSRRLWRWTATMALTALLCGLLLGGVSAWFLGSVAIAGLSAAALTFNFHIPAALVRLFAVGRTAARYGERTLGHKAALTDQVAHRLRLFSAMAADPSVRRAGWQFGDQDRLADYLDDVEDVDFVRLRAGLPALAAGFGFIVLVMATAVVAPLGLPLILIGSLAALWSGRRVQKAGAMAWQRVRSRRRGGAERLGAAMASAAALKAERMWEAESRPAFDLLAEADEDVLTLRRRQSGLDMIGALFGPAAGAATLAAAWLAGLRGEELLPCVFVAFAWVALGESLNGVSRMLVARLRGAAAAGALACWMQTPAETAAGGGSAAPRAVRHAGLQRRSPSEKPLGREPLALDLRAGHPTVLVGMSGSGKTSLLKQIAGWIGDDVFFCEDGPLPPGERRALAMLCLHDAAVIEDTVRANLFAPGRTDEALWQTLDAVELSARVGQEGGLDAWIRQDRLSLGEAQRLNLARAFLSDRPLILLDEPGEHLDKDQGRRILVRLLDHLMDRIVVLSTHAVMIPDEATSPGSIVDLSQP